MFEVHAVDADEEGEGDKDGGEYGEDFHDVVGVFGDVGVVAVLLVGEHGVVDFDGFDRLDDEGVEVAEVFAGGGGDEVGVGAEQPGDGLFDGADVFAEVGEFGFVAVGVLDEFAAGGEEGLFLFFDDVAEFFVGEDVVVHERVDEGVAEVVGGVAGDEEAGAFDFLFADKNEGAGGGAAGELFVFEESCHVFFVCGESGQR